MARTRYGRSFRTRNGIYGRYKYVNGRRVAFVSKKAYNKFRRRKVWRHNSRGKVRGYLMRRRY